MTCPVVTLNGLVMDGVTPDDHGIYYTVQSLDGWWDNTPVRSNSQEVQPVGEVLTVNRENARPLVLTVIAHAEDPNSMVLGDTLCFRSIYQMKTAARLATVPGTITVVDPILTLHSLVRRVGSGVKWSMLGTSHSVLFQVQLLATDPRRYEADNTTTHD